MIYRLRGSSTGNFQFKIDKWIFICGWLVCFFPSIISAQSVLINSYNRIQIGEIGGLQGGAFRARANDASANWYNPAGLVKAKVNSISGNATAYEVLEIGIDNDQSETTIIQIPNFIGVLSLVGEPGERASFAFGWSVVVPSRMESVFNRSSVTSGFVVERDPFNPGAFPVVPISDLEVQNESSSKLSITAPGFAVAFAPSPDFRWGLGVRLYRVEISEQSSTTAFQDSNAGEPFFNFVREEFIQGTANLVRLQGGIQVDFGKHFTSGVAFRSATWTLSSKGIFKFSELFSHNIDTDATDPFDERFTSFTFVTNEEADFEFKLPNEISVGLAWVYPSFEIELDVLFHQKISPYEIFGSVPVVVQIESENRVLQINEFEEPETTEADSVVNIALGGSFRIGDKRRFNFGVFTDNSPENSESEFDAIDLVGVTVGFSLIDKNGSTSFGIVYMTGEDTEAIDNLITEEDETREVSIQSLSIVLAGRINF